MRINDILEQKNITKYRLAKISGVPFATISDICTEKAKIEHCAAHTLYRLSKALDVTMEDLVADKLDQRISFETFKSNICHMVKDKGDLAFIIDTLESDEIRKLWNKKWYPECFYTLAMLDYLCRENDLPQCTNYNDIRSACLQKPIYPASIIAKSVASKSNRPKVDSLNKAIPEFKHFNIVENEVRNVN